MSESGDLEYLRVEVARMRRAATKKISRVKLRHGAMVTGSEFDPRRATTLPSHYTSDQLIAYREKLASFLSRSNQYVPDASKRPIPRSEFREYKQQERKYSESAGAIYDRLKATKLPSGETIAERMAKMTPTHKVMRGQAVNSLFDPHTRESKDVASRAALKKLLKTMKQNAKPSTMNKKIKMAKHQFSEMMNVVNMPELYEAARNLTNDQFTALWNYTSFAGAISLAYLSAQTLLSPKQSSWGVEMLRQQMNDAMEMVSWAKQIKT